MSQNQIKKIKIEGLKKLKRVGFYSLETNQETITVTDDIIVRYSLLKDKELTVDEFELIKKENEKNNYYLKACHYIYYQMRSKEEVIEYLLKYQVNKNDISDIIKRLEDLQLIDDNLLCSLILEKTISSLKGPNVFITKVKQRKLNVNLNDFVYQKDIEEDVIDKVIEKNILKKSSFPVKKQKEQLYAKLLRDGFSHDLINNRINKINFVDDSLKTLDKDYQKALKKYYQFDDKTRRNKIISSLTLKGYSYSQIISKINSIDNNF